MKQDRLSKAPKNTETASKGCTSSIRVNVPSFPVTSPLYCTRFVHRREFCIVIEDRRKIANLRTQGRQHVSAEWPCVSYRGQVWKIGSWRACTVC